MQRRNGEHWLAILFLRRVSLRVTRHVIRTPVTANQLTGVMIVVGLAAAAVVAFPGVITAIVAAVCIQVYFLLDLVDGEVARWHRTTSVVGVYLDRVGHYLVEAAMLTAYGVRVGGGPGHVGGWAFIGLATGLFVILAKAETDLVDVARARSGYPAAADGAASLRSQKLGVARRVLSAAKIHQSTGALESSLLIALASVIDAFLGGVVVQQTLVVAWLVIAGVLVPVHLLSILMSTRLVVE